MMERYSEYKDSGVKWLEEIPSHWELRKMKYTFSERSQKGFPQEPLLASTQTHGVILKSQYENRTVEAIKSLETLKLVEIGDFVISLRSFQGGLEYAYNRGIISPAYTILTPIHIKADYFKYLSKSDIFISLLKSSVTGIREGQNIDYNKLKDNLLPIPSIEEQVSIGAYLDSATSEIDKAIAMQQKMIDLLNERKQIIIQNAVTKGLDENVEMKESGVEWIGKIPKHWEVLNFRHLIKILTDFTANGSFGDLASNVKYLDIKDYARLVRLTDLRNNFDEEKGVWVNKSSYEYLAKSELHGGELLIANVGAYSGLPWIMPNVSFRTTLAPNMFMLKLQDVITEYIYYLLSSSMYFAHLQMVASATAQPKLNKNNIRELNIVLPPKSEQQQIVTYLDSEMQRFGTAITNCQRQITLLQERKQIIINEVVTGKVRVS